MFQILKELLGILFIIMSFPLIKPDKDFPIVTLCGSTRFTEQFDEISMKFTLNGWIVLSIGSHRKSDSDFDISESQFLMLEKMHQKKIDMSDLVFIINYNGYMGAGTKKEIWYAQQKGKKIDYLEPL